MANLGYKVDMIYYDELKKNIEVPQYQRRLVWSNKQKREFIESIAKGYPFGSLLLYKYPLDDKYTIIDGLQRFTTIQDFEKEKGKYFNFDHYADKIIEIVHKPEQGRNKIEKKIKEVLENTFSQDSVEATDLYQNLLREGIIINGSESIELIIMKLSIEIDKDIKNYIDVSNLQIPYVGYLGDESELANVFERLNRGGVKLSKYQVFASQWYRHKIQLDTSISVNNEIIDRLVERYNSLNEERGISIDGYDEDSFRNEAIVNLAEICYCLGMDILDCSYVFHSKDSKKQVEDLANEIGYSTMAIVFGISNNKLEEIANKVDLLSSDKINELFSKIKDIYISINRTMEKYLVSSKDGKYNSELINFQYLSFFASLWMVKFGVQDGLNLKEKNGYKQVYDLILDRIPKYYLYDLVKKQWRATGDKQINDIYINDQDKYLSDLSREKFEIALIDWNDEELQKDSERISSVTNIFLTYFYNIIDVKFNTNKDYDREHIIPKKKLKEIKSRKNKLAGGSIGNICYLDSVENRSKKDDTIYENNKYSETKIINKERLDELRYPTESELSFIYEDISLENKHKKASEFIRSRSKDLITELCNEMFKY